MIKLLETLQWRAHRTSAMEIHWKLTETHRKVHGEFSRIRGISNREYRFGTEGRDELQLWRSHLIKRSLCRIECQNYF